MRTAVVALFLFLLSGFAHLDGRWVSLGGKEGTPPEAKVIESTIDETVLQLEIKGYYEEEVLIEGESYVRISLPDFYPILEKGMPDLPKVVQSLIIPDDGRMGYEVLLDEYTEKVTKPIAPSKGHITRDKNPEDIPYTFRDFYDSDAFFPEGPVSLGEPYILRDFRGVTVHLMPFQFNPASKTLRIHKRLRIKVKETGEGLKNVKWRRTPRVPRDFLEIYERHFVNFEAAFSRYTLIPEPGRLLVITYNSFVDAVLPFVEWKKQKGVPTKLVLYPDSTGSGSDAIKSYIQNEYNSPDGLTYIILVGDVNQVPTLYGTYEGAPSDPSYVKLEGDDHYPDALISRISATSSSQVEYQVSKFVTYEKYPDLGASWYHMGTGIASNEGSPPDWQRAEWLRDSLLNYTYTHVDQIYDPGATAAQVYAALNEGRSIINYIGHGSGTAWGTTGFSNSDVYNLANGYMLPFIIDVACLNGDFTMAECFAEAWLRAGSLSDVKGAIGMYASSTLASWVPPCVMQREAVHLLVSEIRNTFGGLAFNGVMKAMDTYSGSGEDVKIMEQYNLFGDCSSVMRTDTPEELTVSHSPTLVVGQTTFDVSVAGVEDALCALYAEGLMYGYAYTDAAGNATIELEVVPDTPGVLTLTVTAYNKAPYITDIDVISPSGPYLVYGFHTVDDTLLGNGDGEVNPGETIYIKVGVVNVGQGEAVGITGRLSSSDPYVTISDSLASFGDIQPGDTALSTDAFLLDISSSAPNGHLISFDLTLTDTGAGEWSAAFSEMVKAPVLLYVTYVANDSIGGNGDGNIDPGETIYLRVTVTNQGYGDATSVVGSISTTDPYVSIMTSQASFPDIPDSGYATSDTLSLSIDGACPTPYFASVALTLTAQGGYSSEDTFSLLIGATGFSDDMESGVGDWTHYIVTPGYSDQWHLSTSRYHSPTHSWKCGAVSGTYSNFLDAALETPEFPLEPNSELIFWFWMEAETSSYYTGYAYDGGVVEISVDGGEWQLISPEGGYPFKIRGGSGNPLPAETPCFSGYRTWQEVSFDLSDYSGMARIRFRFTSDQGVSREGWYVDDVMVRGRPSPDIEVEPYEFEAILSQNQLLVETLTIFNMGSDTLFFEIFASSSPLSESRTLRKSRDGWLSVSPTSGSVLVGSSAMVSVFIDAQGLGEGVYEGGLAVTSNDPDEPQILIPVVMTVTTCTPGDANGSGEADPADLTYLGNYLFASGPSPTQCGDANGDCDINASDLTYLGNYLFSGGPAPLPPCSGRIGQKIGKLNRAQ